PSAAAMSYRNWWKFSYPADESDFIKSLNSPARADVAYYVVFGTANLLNPDNQSGINGKELITNGFLPPGENDGVVSQFSAVGSDLSWNQFSSAYSSDHVLRSDLTHNNLPDVTLKSSKVMDSLRKWIRLQDIGSANVSVH